jgi:Flp pilus assembly protein TadG
MVEFALVAPLFFMLVFGVIQFGIIFGGQVALGNAAREIARYTSTLPAGQTLATVKLMADPLLRRSIPAYNGSGVTSVAYCYYPNPTNPVTYSWKVAVAISYAHTLFIPLVGALVDRIDGVADNRFTTGVREEMRVETQPIKSVPSGTACGANP